MRDTHLDRDHSTGWVNIRSAGARGNGLDSDWGALQKVIQYAHGRTIYIPPGFAFQVPGPVTLPDEDVFIAGGPGSFLNGTGSSLFRRRTLADGTGRGFLTKIEGLTFTGAAPAFSYDAGEAVLPVATEFYEYELSRCRFLQAAGNYAVSLHGAREGLIDTCYFEGNQGVYADFSVNSEARSCVWKNTTYGVRLFTGCEGLKLIGGTMLGVGYGVWAGTNVAGVQVIGAMIDFCDNPLLFDATTDVLVQGSYLSTRTASPAIFVKKSAGNTPQRVRILGNSIFTHDQTNNRVVRVEDSDDVEIASNAIGYWFNGVEYTNTTNLKIHENRIVQMPGAAGQFSISVGAVGTASVEIRRNSVDKPINSSVTTMVSGNYGDRWGGLEPGTDGGLQQTGRIYQGFGVPNNANGNNGDAYFRTDTPAVANQRLYVKSAGAWLGIL